MHVRYAKLCLPTVLYRQTSTWRGVQTCYVHYFQARKANYFIEVRHGNCEAFTRKSQKKKKRLRGSYSHGRRLLLWLIGNSARKRDSNYNSQNILVLVRKDQPPYKYKDDGWLRYSNYTIVKIQYKPPLCHIYSNPMLFISWSDDQGWHPRLAGQLRKPGDVLAPTGSFPGERASTASLLVYLKTRCSSSRKHYWLPFAGLLVNLAALHRESVLVIYCVLRVHGDLGDLALVGVWSEINPTSVSKQTSKG
jgi:hypothetical protein